MQPCKDMCKVIDFSLAPVCFPAVGSWSWQDSPACRGFASTWAPARQDRNPKCCFMAHLEQPSLVLSSPVQPLSTGWLPEELLAIFPSCVSLPRAGKGGIEASSSRGYDGLISRAWQRLLHEAAQTRAPETGTFPGVPHCSATKGSSCSSDGPGVKVRRLE